MPKAGATPAPFPTRDYHHAMITDTTLGYTWRGAFENAELDALHAAGFGYAPTGTDWRTRLERHSLGWVCARHRSAEPASRVGLPGRPSGLPGGLDEGAGGLAEGVDDQREGADGRREMPGDRDGSLIGFVNVAWDGGVHAFLLDTVVAASHRNGGVGAELVARAAREAGRAGCDWLHVDFEEHLHPFYLDRCGFTPTAAGLLRLNRPT